MEKVVGIIYDQEEEQYGPFSAESFSVLDKRIGHKYQLFGAPRKISGDDFNKVYVDADALSVFLNSGDVSRGDAVAAWEDSSVDELLGRLSAESLEVDSKR